MQKAERQKGQVQNQAAVRQRGRVAVASPQSESIAQLQALAESSPQMTRQGLLAAQINASPAAIAQRKLAARIASSSNMTAQRKFGEGMNSSPYMAAQRKKLKNLYGGAVQLRAPDDESLQGKFNTAQRVEDEEPLQGKFETVQRVEEEEPLQGKFEAAQRVEEEEPLQGKFAPPFSLQLKEEISAKPNNTGLPDNLKSGIESLSGMSMDGVKVHYNSPQPAQLNALAYAQGSDIHVAPGQERHLPHEAWHVVQQAQGRVRPTMQMKEGVPVNDDQGLEHEADAMGAKALWTRTVTNVSLGAATAPSSATQLWPWSKKVEPATPKPEEIEMQSLSTPKKGGEHGNQDLTTKSGLQISKKLTPEQQEQLMEKGDVVVGTVGEAANASSNVADVVKNVDAPAQGLDLANNAGGVFTKIKDGFSNVATIFTAFVSPIIEAGMHFLGMKEKWGQWSTYDAAAKKENAPQEAVYAKDKTKKGFLRHLGLFFQNISDFVANLLLVIPGANVIALGWKLFNLIAGVVKSVVGAAKGLWQFFKGEKKEVHSKGLLDKALANDKDSLQLIFDLKLPSIAGSGYELIDSILGKLSEMSEKMKSSVMEKFGLDKAAGQRIIDINKKKAPTTVEELSALLKLACKNSGSKELILKELKETMTGFGK